MRKIISILIISLFFLSIFPIVISQEEAEAKNPIKEELVKARDFAEIKREKLQKAEINEEILEKFRILEKEKLQNVIKLNDEELINLSKLKEDQIKKLAEIKTARLRKIMSLDKEKINKISSLDKEQLEKLSYLDRASLKKFSELNKEDLNKELQKIEIKKIDPKLLFRKRIMSEKKIKMVEERFQIAKQKLLELKKELDTEIRLLKMADEKNDEEALKEYAKKYLITAADAIINHLEKIKSKIEQSQNIDEEEASNLIKDINAKIEEIENAKLKIGDATTKEEIREAAKIINAAWKRIRIKSEFYVSVLVNKKIEEIIKRSEQLEKKLENILAEMEEKNLNVQSIEEKLTKFSEKIDEARIKFKQSQEKFKEAKSTGVIEDLQKLIFESKSLAKDSRILLKEAHNILIEIIKDIRTLDKTVDFEKEREDEQIIIEEKEIKSKIDVEVEGFLKNSQQKLINSLINNLNQTKTNAEIEIEVKIEDKNLELKKEIKGTLTEEQKDLINKLTDGLEDIEDKVIIKIQSEVS